MLKQTIKVNGLPVSVYGQLPKPGESAKNFTLVKSDLTEATLNDFAGKRKILTLFPSVDTGVCAASVRHFNQVASQLNNTVVLCISADLPFAQARFCGAEGLNNVVMLSTFRSPTFKQDYGVEILDGPLKGLTARAVIVPGENN